MVDTILFEFDEYQYKYICIDMFFYIDNDLINIIKRYQNLT